MVRDKIFLKKRKIIAWLLAATFLLGEILQPVSFLKAATISGIEISVVTVEAGEAKASGDDLETALKNLTKKSGIQNSQIKELVITGGQIREDDWRYLFLHGDHPTYGPSDHPEQEFSKLTDFRAEGTGRGEGAIPTPDDYNLCFPRSVERVKIPDGITSIGDGAFNLCSKMQELTIPGSVKTIGEIAFWTCYNLVEVNMSDGLETIGNSAFAGCPMERLRIPDSVTEVGVSAFSGCGKLKEVFLSKNLKKIKSYAFSGCVSLLSITIPDHVTTVEYRAFWGCRGLKEVVFPTSLESISTGGASIMMVRL